MTDHPQCQLCLNYACTYPMGECNPRIYSRGRHRIQPEKLRKVIIDYKTRDIEVDFNR